MEANRGVEPTPSVGQQAARVAAVVLLGVALLGCRGPQRQNPAFPASQPAFSSTACPTCGHDELAAQHTPAQHASPLTIEPTPEPVFSDPVPSTASIEIASAESAGAPASSVSRTPVGQWNSGRVPSEPAPATEPVFEPTPIGAPPPMEIAAGPDPTPAPSVASPPAGSVRPASVQAAAPPLTEQPARIEPVSNTESPVETAFALVARMRQFNEANPNYVCRITRQEQLGRRRAGPEMMLMKFRLQPRSVYYRWLDEKNEGREAVWVAGANNGKMVTRGGKGDLFLAGKLLRLDPEGTLARSKSRQPITQSGLDRMVNDINAFMQAGRSGRSGIDVKGQRNADRLGNGKPADSLSLRLGPGVDPDWPDGIVEHYLIDAETGRLESISGTDLDGNFLLSYRFERFIPLEAVSDKEFDPDYLWPPAGAKPALRAEERMAIGNAPLPK